MNGVLYSVSGLVQVLGSYLKDCKLFEIDHLSCFGLKRISMLFTTSQELIAS